MNNSISPKKPNSLLKFSTYDLVLGGMFAAVLAVISQISLPMPTGVPITVQVFGIAITGVVLGSRLGLMSTLVYILLGAVGLPIFAGFRGGFDVLTNVTGGYIWSWPFMVVLCGIKPVTSKRVIFTGMVLALSLTGLIINELIGALQWAALAGDMSIWGVLLYSITAFIPKDILLTVLAVFSGLQIRKVLVKAGFLHS